jgi:hypothetical protein
MPGLKELAQQYHLLGVTCLHCAMRFSAPHLHILPLHIAAQLKMDVTVTLMGTAGLSSKDI